MKYKEREDLQLDVAKDLDVATSTKMDLEVQ